MTIGLSSGTRSSFVILLVATCRVVRVPLLLGHAHAEFGRLYTEAKRSQIEVFVEDIVDISDDNKRDAEVDKSGKKRINRDFYERSRLRVDTRKWLACKLAPRIYGDKVQSEISGKDGMPIEYVSLTEEQKKQKIAEIFNAAKDRTKK